MLSWFKGIITRINKYDALKLKYDNSLKHNIQLIEESKDIIEDYQDLTSDYMDINEAYQKTLLPIDTQALIEYYYDKYRMQQITYKGLQIHLRNAILHPDILVQDFIHITESMRRWIKDNKLEYIGDNTPESISKHQYKVYSKFTEFTKYKLDSNLYGENEKWISNFEQMYVKSSGKFLCDCENMANLCCGLILASGVPPGLVRVTCGMTNSGFGHATLTAWDYRSQRFEIWETTSTFPRVIKRDTKYDFKTIWFSYDNENSWSTLDKTKYKKVK